MEATEMVTEHRVGPDYLQGSFQFQQSMILWLLIVVPLKSEGKFFSQLLKNFPIICSSHNSLQILTGHFSI